MPLKPDLHCVICRILMKRRSPKRRRGEGRKSIRYLCERCGMRAQKWHMGVNWFPPKTE